jgi:predicted permease
VEAFKAVTPVVPVFFLIAAGFLFAKWKEIPLRPLTEFIVFFTTPSLIFTSLARRPLNFADIAAILAGAVGILAIVGILILIYFSVFRFRSRGFAVPVLFMNAGNIGLPLALFALGEPGMQRATLYFVLATLIHNTFGIYLLNARDGWKEIFRLPLIYVTLAGLLFNIGKVPVPDLVFEPLRMLGNSTIPLMLVSLGFRLNDMKSVTWGHSLGGALIRIFGGLAAGYAVVTLLDIDGINRQIILLYSSLPSAVVNFVLTEKYNQDPQLAASIILLTTLISVATIPLVLWLIL